MMDVYYNYYDEIYHYYPQTVPGLTHNILITDQQVIAASRLGAT
jgi:hypothetical protein